jgi:hypothetical protein
MCIVQTVGFLLEGFYLIRCVFFLMVYLRSTRGFRSSGRRDERGANLPSRSQRVSASEWTLIIGGSDESKTYNGEVRSSENDFETLPLDAFATPGLLLAHGPGRF